MDPLKNVINPNSSLIKGDKIRSVINDMHTLTFHDPLRGHKPVVPVSAQINSFIKDAFSKIKK